ncbi:hypothetical protein AAFF_G00141900 [Aldrovandia affinis]|uniref:S1 RNA binding domain 1 n=1 Tax=Aldrovandia affinis TaxID=143900 RepID=A0AAD7X299_9TELE|nr:hypothetical protein AAFF_G00141900 [Aldrovandia affinis]
MCMFASLSHCPKSKQHDTESSNHHVLQRKSTDEDDFDKLSQQQESEEEEEEEEEEAWEPAAKKPAPEKKPAAKKPAERKAAIKKPAKPKEPKPKVPRKAAERKPRAPRGKKGPAVPAEQAGGTEGAGGIVGDTAAPGMAVEVKEERLSFGVPAGGNYEASSSQQPPPVKKEEPEDDFTFDEPVTKKMKTSAAPQGRPVRQPRAGKDLRHDLQMNWDPIQVLSEITHVEPWVCANIVELFQEENTIPFIVRYRKELINHMDADAVREVQHSLEELCAVSKKSQSISQTLKKEGVLTAELEETLKNCRSPDELEYVYAPYKKGSKLSKARRAKQLGLEPAAHALLQEPRNLNLQALVKPGSEGLSSWDEVATGVEQILADMIAKDKETLTFVRSLCDRNAVTLHSSVSKTALKEQQQQGARPGKPKDIDKFRLYCDFTCNVQRIQHHQTLAINRGESLKILTVKVNIPDRVKNELCRWCVNVRSVLNLSIVVHYPHPTGMGGWRVTDS